MSSLNDFVAVWRSAETYLYRIGGPTIMVIGCFGCIVNLLVFTQKDLRKNPCSIYFIVYNGANFLAIFALFLPLTLSIGYHIDPSLRSLDLCRLRLYTSILFNCLSPFYLTLISIDRSLVTSPNARTRQLSTRRLAYVCLTIGTVFWLVFHSHAIIFGTILQMGPTSFVCYFQRGTYRAFLGYYILLKEVIGLIVMVVCGLLSIKNVRRLRHVRVAPPVFVSRTVTGVTTNTVTAKDQQLILMLCLDIVTYVLFSFMYAALLVYQQITQYDIKSAELAAIERVITSLCFFGIGIPYCTSCYANLLVSKTFRKELVKIFS